MAPLTQIVVAGGGVAGLRACERLRELGFNGEIAVVGGERHLPYHRPFLTSRLLKGALNRKEIGLPAYRDLAIRWLPGVAVDRLDTVEHQLHLADGRTLDYDGLVIATGMMPSYPDGLPRRSRRMHRLWSLDHAVALREALSGDRGPVVVLGGGFVGCEVASSLRAGRRKVTLVEQADTLLGPQLGAFVGRPMTELHAEHGVQLELGTAVVGVSTSGQSVDLLLANGKMLRASHVVVCLGGTPAVGWLRGSGLAVNDGVLCDPTCHAVGADDVVAAGDVACWPNLRVDGVPRSSANWLDAMAMGRAAAENLLRGKANSVPFTPIPRGWTEQYDVRLQIAGFPALRQRVARPTGGSRSVLAYLRDNQMVGVVMANQTNAVPELVRHLERELAVPPISGPHSAAAGCAPRASGRSE